MTVCRPLLCAAALCALLGSLARGQQGTVHAGSQPIPGAVVTASQDATRVTTVTGADGRFELTLPGAGRWTIEVQMLGFAPQQRAYDASGASGGRKLDFNLQLAPSPIAQRLQQLTGRSANPGASPLETQIQNELNGVQVSAPGALPAGESSHESFLLSGSLSRGLAPNSNPDSGPAPPGGEGGRVFEGGPSANSRNPVAPGFENADAGGGTGFGPGLRGGGGRFGPGGGFPGGFGNRQGRPGAQFGNRRRPSGIRGMAFFSLNNSALNAKPVSFTGGDVPQPAYAQTRFGLIAGGPLTLPKLIKDPQTTFFFTYFGTRARSPQSFVATLPSALERTGDFSQSVQATGAQTAVPVRIYDPLTRLPFPNNRVPASRLSPTALALLNDYPLPNQPTAAHNYLFQTAVPQNTDNLNVRVQRNITKRDRLAGNFNLQNRNGETAQVLRFLDRTSGLGLRAGLQWTRNLGPNLTNTATVNFNRNRDRTTPFFAGGPDVARQLGIQGTSDNPLNFGPPNLNFTNFAPLSDASPLLTRNQTQSFGDSLIWTRGAHSFSLGAQFGRNDLNTLTDQNGRGTYNFTGLLTSAFDSRGTPINGSGFDLADFLLGLPQSSSIRYGDSSLYFRQNTWSAYAQDDWKARPNLTIDLGLRYEYFAPFREKYNRLANLDIGPGFTTVAVATPGTVGPYSGAFPSGLIDADKNNFGPRIGLAWRLSRGQHATVIRSGYGVYYNGQAYNSFTLRLAQQPPFAVSNSANTSATNVLTLNTGFVSATPAEITNTFAVDRHYRTPYAQTWNLSVQQEVARGFFVELGYLGTNGTRLDVQTLPNQGPPGSVLNRRDQLGNATGFTFDSSVGNSIYHALQVRATQRFRRGLSFSAYYTWSKSIDDSSTFGGAGNTVAQNWLDLHAERGLSSFDHRHAFDINAVWTSPIGATASRIAADSLAGRLLKDWQLSGSLNAQTGAPFTARVLGNQAQLAQTGAIGRGRANASGEDLSDGTGSANRFFNLAAFTLPAPGQFGNAGRNTIPGPGQVTLNLGFGRAFQLDESRRRLELRIEATNLLNHVNFTTINSVVNASDYGLPTAAASMRSLNLVARFRF